MGEGVAGKRIASRYRLQYPVGVGGMGKVWRARDEVAGRDVAVKILHAPSDAVRFRREARYETLLDHPHIVSVLEFVEDGEETRAIVMEYLRGETLDRYLERKGPLPLNEALAIVLPILSALEHAHEQGVVHRDVKPANIFLALDTTGSVVPKLVDFGLAKAIEEAAYTTANRAIGTEAYMSPEQLHGYLVDGRSDIFSCGMVLYECLTAQRPFGVARVSQLFREPAEDPLIDPRLWPALERSLAKPAHARHQTASEMSDALRAAVGGPIAPLNLAIEVQPPLRLLGSLEGSAFESDSSSGYGLLQIASAGERRERAPLVAGACLVGFLLVIAVWGLSGDPAMRPSDRSPPGEQVGDPREPRDPPPRSTDPVPASPNLAPDVPKSPSFGRSRHPVTPPALRPGNRDGVGATPGF